MAAVGETYRTTDTFLHSRLIKITAKYGQARPRSGSDSVVSEYEVIGSGKSGDRLRTSRINDSGLSKHYELVPDKDRE